MAAEPREVLLFESVDIPAEIAGRVFEQFFTTRGVGRGTGQGLVVAYSLIHNRHAGSITFTSGVNRILFVDDQPAILDAIRRSFRSQRARWQMQFAHSGAGALDLLAAEPVDVIVTDFRMPDMDGGQLLTLVRERWPHTARLILSGYSGLQDQLTASNLAHEYLNKPCSSEELECAIERALAHMQPD